MSASNAEVERREQSERPARRRWLDVFLPALFFLLLPLPAKAHVRTCEYFRFSPIGEMGSGLLHSILFMFVVFLFCLAVLALPRLFLGTLDWLSELFRR